jgi:hypothetical protein
MPCPSDRLVTKLRHYTTPVKWVMPARRPDVPCRTTVSCRPKWLNGKAFKKPGFFVFFQIF